MPIAYKSCTFAADEGSWGPLAEWLGETAARTVGATAAAVGPGVAPEWPGAPAPPWATAATSVVAGDLQGEGRGRGMKCYQR